MNEQTYRAWPITNFIKSTNTTIRTNGWSFTPKEDIILTALEIYSDAVNNVTMNLWDKDSAYRIIDHSFISDTNKWSSSEIQNPIQLNAGREYIITANIPLNGGYLYAGTNEDRIDANNGEFSSHITFITNYRSPGISIFPTESVNGVFVNSVGFMYSLMPGDPDPEPEPDPDPDIDIDPIGIKLIRSPNKLIYNIGESLNLEGLRVVWDYDDDTLRDIIITNNMVSGFNSNIGGVVQTITITVDGFKAYFTVQIIKEPNKSTTGIYDKNNVLITKLVDTALSYPDVIEVKNRTLDGRWHIQTIGEGATVLVVKAHLTLSEKNIMDNLHRTKDLFKVIFDGKYHIGILDGKPDYDRQKFTSHPMFGTSFTMLVREEGDT